MDRCDRCHEDVQSHMGSAKPRWRIAFERGGTEAVGHGDDKNYDFSHNTATTTTMSIITNDLQRYRGHTTALALIQLGMDSNCLGGRRADGSVHHGETGL